MSEEKKSQYLPVLNAFPTRSETLVLRAEGMLNLGGDDRLTTQDRRDAITYLLSVRPDLNNLELARLFQVDEKTVRNDKEAIRKRLAEDIGDKDIALVVSDIMRGHERIMTELAKSTKKCVYGTTTFLSHLKFEAEQNFKIVEVLQSLGVYPKNLGNLTKTNFMFKAHVAKGGGVNTVAVETLKDVEIIEDAECKMLPQRTESDEDRALRAQFDVEFPDAPLAERPNNGPA